MDQIVRQSVTKDEYQESLLAAPFAGWSKGAYRLLAAFSGWLAVMIYASRISLIVQPMMGWPGYLLFQIMTGGICIIALYGSFYNRRSIKEIGQHATFNWWGYWVADFFMASVFFPFAIVVVRVMLSGAGQGLFIDLGGWEALFHPDTPLNRLIPLFLIGILLVMIMLGMFYIPIWLFYRSLLRLRLQLKHGTNQAFFDQALYHPGQSLQVKITSRLSVQAPEAMRRVFINYLEDFAVNPPGQSKNYQRKYLYSEFQEATLSELEQGILFSLPNTLAFEEGTMTPTGPAAGHYWEILVEEPGKMYWAQFFFKVE